MLIDWMSLKLDLKYFTDQAKLDLQKFNDRILRFNPSTGEYINEWSTWDSIRSDSHYLSFRVTHELLYIQGSPARCIGQSDAVIGEGASNQLDLIGCFHCMAKFAFDFFGLTKGKECPVFFDYNLWQITRIDITENLILKDLTTVKQALSILRNCEGGRYKVTEKAGDSVYWSKDSKLVKAKAYAKGPHIEYQMRKPDYHGYQYTDQQKKILNQILRLEVTLGSQFFREIDKRSDYKHWHELTPQYLKNRWKGYFERMIGGETMNHKVNLLDKLTEVAKTKRQANAAYQCWLQIKNDGYYQAKEFFSKPTWYRHISLMKKAGLTDADISHGTVVHVNEQRIIEAQVLTSWDQFIPDFNPPNPNQPTIN